MSCHSTKAAVPCKSGGALQTGSRAAQDAQPASRAGCREALRQLARGDDRLDRQVVRSLYRERRAVGAEGEQRVAWPDPDPVEREQRPARGKGALARRMAEQGV